jgi:hypothetical protein
VRMPQHLGDGIFEPFSQYLNKFEPFFMQYI